MITELVTKVLKKLVILPYLFWHEMILYYIIGILPHLEYFQK